MKKIRMDLDLGKLSEDDRRFLMNREMSIVMSHSTNKMTNSILFWTITSICIAVFSLVYSLYNTINDFVLTVLVLGIVFICYVYIKVKHAQSNVVEQIRTSEKFHNALFLKHFKYAQKPRSSIGR